MANRITTTSAVINVAKNEGNPPAVTRRVLRPDNAPYTYELEKMINKTSSKRYSLTPLYSFLDILSFFGTSTSIGTE
mgnify:CR=1 FL=1